jgi:nitric oxide reductase NorQ protein
VVCSETGIERATATQLVGLAHSIRRLDASLLREVASTRLLVSAGRLIAAGLEPRTAAQAAIGDALSDDPAVEQGLREILEACVPERGGPGRS